jgi:uncharacterized protein YggE
MGRRFALVTFLTPLAAASPATALDRLIDTGNDHWVEVTGEGSVNAAPDFARVTLGVTNSAKTASEAMAANAKAANTLVSLIKSEGVTRRHPDLRGVDFADVLATGPTDRADDHRR